MTGSLRVPVEDARECSGRHATRRLAFCREHADTEFVPGSVAPIPGEDTGSGSRDDLIVPQAVARVPAELPTTDRSDLVLSVRPCACGVHLGRRRDPVGVSSYEPTRRFPAELESMRLSIEQIERELQDGGDR